MKDRDRPRPCPVCKKVAPRHVPADVVGVFSIPVTGPVPQNTGLSGLDTHIDRVIGRHAQQGWATIETRVQEKRRVLSAHPGTDGGDLSRNPDGTYRILNPEERAVHDRANTINNLAMAERQKKKDSH